MKFYEFCVGFLRPFLPTIHGTVNKKLKNILRPFCRDIVCLDVGGRKSPYTVGVKGYWTITDLRRETEKQKKLNLGINEEMIEQTKKSRSNVCIIIDDMMRSALPTNTYDCVVSVEVLEHVSKPELFIENIHRVLKPGGVFLMTTPNADHPGRKGIVGEDDFVIYYTKIDLKSLLSKYFGLEVKIEYAIPVGPSFTRGLRSWSYRHPVRTLLSMMGNLVTKILDSREDVKSRSVGTRHLIATCRKPT